MIWISWGWKHGIGTWALYVEDVLAIVEQGGWVAEGNYLMWVDALLYEADYIVLIDVPWYVAVWRVLWRHVEKSLRGTNPYKTKHLWPLLDGMRTCYDRSPAIAFESVTAEFAQKYLELYREMTVVPTMGFTEEFAREYLDVYKRICEPANEEFVKRYHEFYPEDREAPTMEFLRMHYDVFRNEVEAEATQGYVREYLKLFGDKVVVVKNNAERDRFLKLIAKE